jgi:sugar phosphate isomerase/epimerase
VLPGDGDVDYRAFLQAMTEVRYHGPIVVEVSANVFNQSGYDPIASAQSVWDNLSPIFAA